MNASNLKSLMDDLRQEYLASFPEKFDKLLECFNKQDWYSIELEYHKLKGTGTTYGIPEVSQLCEILERLCREHKTIDKETLDSSILLLGKIKDKYEQDIEFDLASHIDFLKIKSR